MRRTVFGFFGTLLVFGLSSREVRAEAPPLISAARVNGVYQQGDNKISLLSLGGGKVRVQFDLNELASVGYALGDGTLAGDTLTYSEPPNGTACKTLLKFLPKDQLDVGVYTNCGFGPHNGASGQYRKLKGGVPKFMSAVPVASSGALDGARAPSAEASFEALATTARLDAADAALLARSAASTLTQIASLAARRTQMLAALKTEQTERTKHASLAAAGYQKHRAGVAKAASNAAAVEGLKAARAEAAQAAAQGQALISQSAALRALEEELFQLASKSAQLSEAANVSAKDAQSVSTALQTGAKTKDPKAPSNAASALAKSSDAQRQATDAKAAATAASADATKALQLAGLGPLSGYSSRKARAQQEDQKLERDVVQNNSTMTQIDVALKPPGAPAAASTAIAAIAGAAELPSSEVRKLYGAAADETMQAHAEILSAMKVFDSNADVLNIPNDNRVVRLAGGREILLMSGRTCRACGEIGYWIVWEAKSRVVAFVRADTNVPVYGKPDPALRAVLDQFVKQTPL